MKTAKLIFRIAAIFWLIETTYFIGKYGWHWTAYNTTESICDGIVSILLGIALYQFMKTLIKKINTIYENEKKDNH